MSADPYEDWKTPSYLAHNDPQVGRSTWRHPMPPVRPTSAPKRKSLDFENFRFTYDYVSNHLYAEELLAEDQKTRAPRQIRFTREELTELAAALKSFGMGLPEDHNQVICR